MKFSRGHLATLAALVGLVDPTQAQAAAPTVGGACKPAGTQKSFTQDHVKHVVLCAKVGKKMIWLDVPQAPVSAVPSQKPGTKPVAPSPSPLTSTTFLGDVVEDRWGSTQVSITVAGGRMTGITTPMIPKNKLAEFAAYKLTNEALKIQSAAIHATSGASYTSLTWQGSLYSAMSKAGLKTGLAANYVIPVKPTPTPTPTKTIAPITYSEIGVPTKAADNTTVTLLSMSSRELAGSIQLTINYRLQNLTTDQKLDEGQFGLFFADGTYEPQYGFFNYLFPAGSLDRSYTWEFLKSISPTVVSYGAGFSARVPSATSLNWKVS